jgi:ATP-dependent metalloprotease FtsH
MILSKKTILQSLFIPIIFLQQQTGLHASAYKKLLTTGKHLSVACINPAILSLINDIQEANKKAAQRYGDFKLQESQKPLQATTSSKESFANIIGMNSVLNEVNEVVSYVKDKKRYTALGAQTPRGILLAGPSGTGKTMLARAIAHESGCKFIYASASSFIEMYVGVGAQRIRALFEEALANQPAIIFIDEIDAIGSVDRNSGGANQEYRQTLNQLLCLMDGFDNNHSVIVIAATNCPDTLDKALTRSGRFDRIIHVPLPDAIAREQILRHYIAQLPKTTLRASFIKTIAERTNHFSGADIKNLVNQAAFLAVQDKADAVEEKHIEIATSRMISQRKFNK